MGSYPGRRSAFTCTKRRFLTCRSLTVFNVRKLQSRFTSATRLCWPELHSALILGESLRLTPGYDPIPSRPARSSNPSCSGQGNIQSRYFAFSKRRGTTSERLRCRCSLCRWTSFAGVCGDVVLSCLVAKSRSRLAWHICPCAIEMNISDRLLFVNESTVRNR